MKMRGLYGVTGARSSLRDIEHALRGGVQWLQYRYKETSAAPLASDVARLCARYGVPLIINDDVELAYQVGAAGVHLGRDDLDPGAARRRLGVSAVIGVSCYDDIRRAEHAVAAGADYVAFGRFFPSVSKPMARGVAVDVLVGARARVNVPIVAIGGITPENAAPLLRAGADAVAVIDGLFGQADIVGAAQRYRAMWAGERPINDEFSDQSLGV